VISYLAIGTVEDGYDRVIEHFLYIALQKDAGFTEEMARENICNARIIRPYGSVGLLPWQDGDTHASFGDANLRKVLVSAANLIKTYAERSDASGFRDSIQEVIAKAAVIVFLGFGFHRQNLSIFASPAMGEPKSVFGTAKGIDKANYESMIRRLANALQSFNYRPQLFDMKAEEMLC
jgi:hypothetical protein